MNRSEIAAQAANVPYIAEYGSEAARSIGLAKHETVSTGTHILDSRLSVLLQHVSAGYEIAGSALRYQAESYRVVYHMNDGTRHGFSGLTHEEAAQKFAAITKGVQS